MARVSLLTKRHRDALMRFPHPTEQRLLARYYIFSPEDLAVIGRQRSPLTQLTLALHLCVLRYPGRVWKKGEDLPAYLIQMVAEQVGLSPQLLEDYDHDPALRREQLRTIRRSFGFRRFTPPRKEMMHTWLMPTALSTDRASVLMTMLVEKMRAEQIILPAFSSLETFLHSVMQAAEAENIVRLTSDLNDEQKAHLDLLPATQSETTSYLWWLCQPPGQSSADNLLAVIDRLTFIRQIGLPATASYAVNANRISQLAREAERLSAWRLARLVDDRRYATLVAFVLHRRAILVDQALEMFLVLYRQVFTRARNDQRNRFYEERRPINQHLRDYVEMGKALIAARDEQTDPFEALEQIMPWDQFVARIMEAEALVRPKHFDVLELVNNRYSYVRRFTPTLLQTFSFDGHDDTQPLRQGLQLLHELNEGDRSDLPEWAPTDFVDDRWRPYVIVDGTLQRRYYELCAFSKLRDSLRSGDIWVPDSRNFQSLRSFLIPDDQWQQMLAADSVPVSVPVDPMDYLADSRDALDEQLQVVDEGLATNAFPDVELTDDRLKIRRTKLDIPADMKQVKRAVYKLLPRIRITDLLWEVDATVGFSRHFTHMQSEERLEDIDLLHTVILAGAINLGLEKMAVATRRTTYSKLAWVQDWFVRDQTYSRALAELVHFQLANPFAHHWGSGMTSSSDGQYFPVGGWKSMRSFRNPYYGSEPGIAFYTHVADLHAPYHVQVIATRVHEAPYMLNGLLHHDTQLDIREHSTDTKGFTDHIFGLCHLLGFRFAPRIRRFSDLRLYSIRRPKHYPTLQPLIGGRINTGWIYDDWLDMLLIASSLRLGTVTPPVFLQRLAAYPRQNRWAKTLREIGRLERTFFALQWIQDPLMRERVFTALYKGEARNALARAVFIHRHGRVRDRGFEEQRYRASALNLVVTAIIVWNTIYIEQAVAYLRQQGMTITDQHLQHLTPLGWEHISLTGDYIWDTSITTSLETLRDLRT